MVLVSLSVLFRVLKSGIIACPEVYMRPERRVKVSVCSRVEGPRVCVSPGVKSESECL